MMEPQAIQNKIDNTTDYLDSHIKPLISTIIENLIQHKPENPNLYIIKLIENFSKNTNTSLVNPNEQALNKLYLHKSLIKPESEDYFNFYYTSKFECVICKDTIFDPISCEGCGSNFCRSCILDKSKTEKYLKFTSCHHESIGLLSGKFTEELEKVKVNCYFKCNEYGLNLLNYSEHLTICKEKHEKKMQKKTRTITELNTHKEQHSEINEVDKTDKQVIDSSQLEAIKEFYESKLQLMKTNQIKERELQAMKSNTKNKEIQKLYMHSQNMKIELYFVFCFSSAF